MLCLHSSPKELHIDFIQFSWWPRVTDPCPGSSQVCQMVFGVICEWPFDKIKMTRGQGRWPRDLRKLGWFSCARYSEKSVKIMRLSYPSKFHIRFLKSFSPFVMAIITKTLKIWLHESKKMSSKNIGSQNKNDKIKWWICYHKWRKAEYEGHIKQPVYWEECVRMDLYLQK